MNSIQIQDSVQLIKYNLFIYLLLININCLYHNVAYAFPRPSNSESEVGCSSPTLPFLWKVMYNKTVKSYLFGTIHLPYTWVWNTIPRIVQDSLQKSDNVYFELDFLNASTVHEMRDCQYLSNGTLKDILPADMFNRLSLHIKYVRRMMPKWVSSHIHRQLFKAITRHWQRKRIIWVLIMLNSLTKDDLQFRGTPSMDIHLAQYAKRLNKLIGAIEKVNEQCDPLNSFNLTQAIFALNITLSQHEAIRLGLAHPSNKQDMINKYKCGQIDSFIFNQKSSQVPYLKESKPGIQSSSKSQMIEDIDESFRKKLVLERNRRMGHRIVSLLESNPEKVYFFAFGVGHFLGNHSIIDFVRYAGYEVIRVSNQDVEDVTSDK